VSSHIEGWGRFIAEELADAWASPLNVASGQLTQRLTPFHLAFLRGRIERAAAHEFTVFQADDLFPTGIAPAEIERAFWLGSEQVNWMIDLQMKCRTDHKDAVRHVLSIADDWPSAI
jgi:hypothetical protein